MTDDLEDLTRAMDAALPAPNPERRSQALALAMKNFDELHEGRQENSAAARPTFASPKGGLIKGVTRMIRSLSTRGMLTLGTAVAAIGLLAVSPVMQQFGPDPVLPAPPSVVLHSSEQPSSGGLSALMAPSPAHAPSGGVQGLGNPLAAPQMMITESARRSGAYQQPRSAATSVQNQSILTPVLDAPAPRLESNTEAFSEAEPGSVQVVAETPVSTFSVDVDTAAWSIIRNSLNWGRLPPAGAVRLEEMINYFDYDYAAPSDAPFATHLGVTESPWRAGAQIVQIGLQGAVVTERPPLNLVFLIDSSGSMSAPNKLPLLKQSFRLMLGQLDPSDSVAIVTYAGEAGTILEPTEASDREAILAALDGIGAGGGTAGRAGLTEAYAVAESMADDGDVTRVILATDGDFNIGISDPEALKDVISKERESGTYLSVLGFGRGNLNDATMQALAQTGNGMAAYIDTLAEAQKVLVDQVQGALFPIADDVKVQVEWNPATVAEYRLIGYETRALNREDFKNDRVDAGEIGAGHQVTALYEIVPVGSDARQTDPLRYASETSSGGSVDELGFLRLRYKAPGDDTSQLIETPIAADLPALGEAQFALAIAGFGELLRGSDQIGDWSWGDAIALAQANRGEDRFGHRQEAVTLMRLAQSLAQ